MVGATIRRRQAGIEVDVDQLAMVPADNDLVIFSSVVVGVVGSSGTDDERPNPDIRFVAARTEPDAVRER